MSEISHHHIRLNCYMGSGKPGVSNCVLYNGCCVIIAECNIALRRCSLDEMLEHVIVIIFVVLNRIWNIYAERCRGVSKLLGLLCASDTVCSLNISCFYGYWGVVVKYTQ